jgi:uridine phosphorylase
MKKGDLVYRARVSTFNGPEVKVGEAAIVSDGIRADGQIKISYTPENGYPFSFRSLVGAGSVHASRRDALASLESWLANEADMAQRKLAAVRAALWAEA